MKTFFASMLGTVTGLILFVVVGFLLLVGFIGAMAAFGNKTPTMTPGSYLVVDLNANITDAPVRVNPLEFLTAYEDGDFPKSYQLRAVTRSLRAAATDSRVAGVFLTGSLEPSNYGSSLPALREIRRALMEVRESGKPVVAYLDTVSLREVYLLSVASEVIVDPYAQIVMPGLAAETMFMAGALEKLGIGVQVARVGKYKSAIEPLTRRDLSPENRTQLQELLDSLWSSVRDEIAQARGMNPALLQQLVDREALILPESAKEAGLVTRVAYRDEVIADLRQRTGSRRGEPTFKQVSLSTYMQLVPESRAVASAETNESGSKRGRVAVVYAEGVIVDGEGRQGEVGGHKFAREIRRLRQDDDVSAIVLRVNSPGGSAAASEHILRELRLARDAKPVVVSMGGYAASGGYWISSFAHRILAEPATITGSIGVFSVLIDIAGLSEKLGLTYDGVKTAKFADIDSIARPKNLEELAIFQRDADRIYEDFLDRVAQGRSLDRDKVVELAQGRVWSGADAAENGLVDAIGGLDDAVREAAKLADLGADFQIREYPRQRGFGEALTEAMESMRPNSRRGGIMEKWVAQLEAQLTTVQQFNDPRGLYARLPLEVHLP